MKKELIHRRSQNGRYGVIVVGDEGIAFPAEGKLFSLGKIEGKETFEFVPCETGELVIIGDDLSPVAGCTTVVHMDLQGPDSVTVLLGNAKFCAFHSYGYKRRSSTVHCLVGGQLINVPASVLVAMGVLDGTREEVNLEIPELSGTLAAALLAAGLTGGE